ATCTPASPASARCDGSRKPRSETSVSAASSSRSRVASPRRGKVVTRAPSGIFVFLDVVTTSARAADLLRALHVLGLARIARRCVARFALDVVGGEMSRHTLVVGAARRVIAFAELARPLLLALGRGYVSGVLLGLLRRRCAGLLDGRLRRR